MIAEKLECVQTDRKTHDQSLFEAPKGGFGGDRRVTLRFKRNSSMLEERGYRYALVLPV